MSFACCLLVVMVLNPGIVVVVEGVAASFDDIAAVDLTVRIGREVSAEPAQERVLDGEREVVVCSAYACVCECLGLCVCRCSHWF